ncbi:NAD(P)-binding protein [Phlebopus sp. FC_14]|nr:NAD(P)-binding protein [Phlebopus sp. FC_14]
MDFGLNGVHVLVTGASGGIGLETARLYCSIGANVTAHYNTKFGPLEELSKAYPTLQTLQSDLSDETSVSNMFSSLSQKPHGPVQIAIVNHGIWPAEDVPLAEMSLERWNHTIAANLTSSFLVCREYLKALAGTTPEIREKASIVLIGSTAGKYGEAGHADYAVTKSAMMYGLTLTLKNEIVKIAPKGRVNAVAPGWVRTPMAEAALQDPEVVYRALATTPLKKVAMPVDIANQIVVLSSTTVSSHVTGQVLMVEGGMEGRLLNTPQDL